MLGYLVRNWGNFVNLDTMKTLYYSFIRSKLEYASIIWSPMYINSIVDLEGVQRKCLKYMYFRCYGQYPSRGFDHSILTDSLGIELLKLRRERFGLTFLFKILQNSIDSPFLLSKINIRVPRPGLRRNNTFYVTYSRSNVMSRSPINFICNLYDVCCGRCDIYFDRLAVILACHSEQRIGMS
ncbi:hypothetical protein WA026_022437 [Henosepilachna vigintioctopunctata]|uniref:Uncharacterized protein n=1 Tax=Henosepilachna vigintioctopunctata TaxID=420089 RepID=A0AAW1UEK7_9CUCU